MQTSRRTPRIVVLGILIACPLLAAAVFGGIAFAIAVAVGASQSPAVGALVAVIVGVVNALALCMALALGDNEAPVLTSSISGSGAQHELLAQAS